MTLHKVVAPVFAASLKLLWQCSYSQRFQDVFAVAISLVAGVRPSQATYIEFGGMHPYNNSNSYLLEQLGWQGVVAEPNPAFFSSFKQLRSCRFVAAAISEKRGAATLFVPAKRRARAALSGYADLNSDGKSIPIELITLEDLVIASQISDQITFLSADTEGGELETLLAYPSLSKRVRSICIEYGSSRDSIYRCLSGLGYQRAFAEVSGEDDWYVREDVLASPGLSPDEVLKELAVMKTRLESRSLPSPGFDDERRERKAHRMISLIEN
jgi:FkbM family methyltransferase